MSDTILRNMLLAGLVVCGLALAWLAIYVLSVVFRRRIKFWKPSLLLALGVALVAVPPLYTRFRPIDLGPRDKRVGQERHVTLTGWDRKDYSVLASCPDVVVLQMANPDVTDSTLDYLKPMSRLRELDLNNSAVTDGSLPTLAALPRLEVLHVGGTRITDEGFASILAKKPSLMRIDLTGTGVSKDSARAWKKSDPKRRVLQ